MAIQEKKDHSMSRKFEDIRPVPSENDKVSGECLQQRKQTVKLITIYHAKSYMTYVYDTILAPAQSDPDLLSIYVEAPVAYTYLGPLQSIQSAVRC